jgi:hypothetical protein
MTWMNGLSDGERTIACGGRALGWCGAIALSLLVLAGCETDDVVAERGSPVLPQATAGSSGSAGGSTVAKPATPTAPVAPDVPGTATAPVAAPPVITCMTGFHEVSGACTDLDECATDNGGCVAECKNDEGGHTCEGCPVGYLGGGDDACVPALIDLAVSPGTLAPQFTPATYEYRATVPLTAATIDITVTTPEDAVAAIDGEEVESGKPWRSGMLALGETAFEIEVSRPEYPSSTYALIVTRGQGQEGYLKANNAGADDGFGNSVALSETTLVIGAPREDGSPDPEAAPDALQNSGAAYVFVRSGTGWVQQAYLKASNAGANDTFGRVVALSGDTVVVGAPGEGSSATGAGGDGADNAAPGSGAAYVFVRDGDTWTEQAYLKASNTGANDGFGSVLNVSGDTIVIGAPREASDGTGVESDGSTDTSPGSGAAYVFVRDDGKWAQQALLKASTNQAQDAFGFAVAIDEDTIVVGAIGEDSDATDVDGAQDSNALANSGAAYVFARDDGAWTQQAFLKAPTPGAGSAFGYSVSVSGRTIVVGAPGEISTAEEAGSEEEAAAADPEAPPPAMAPTPTIQAGAAHVFVLGRKGWSVQTDLRAADGLAGDAFGASVKVLGDTLLVGAWGEDTNAAGIDGTVTSRDLLNSGAAYLFVRDGKRWSEPAFIKASNARRDDQFGRFTALAKNAVAIGGLNEDSGAVGVGGNQGDASAPNSGAVYVFR